MCSVAQLDQWDPLQVGACVVWTCPIILRALFALYFAHCTFFVPATVSAIAPEAWVPISGDCFKPKIWLLGGSLLQVLGPAGRQH